jgi:tripartite-type tricarboxylate transporter receptor subunit TctC
MRSVACSLFLALCIVASGAHAQSYPARPIHLVVAIPPGGAPDIAARIVAEKLSQTMGQPIVVDNKPGANGNIAAEFVAKAPPDGYTLLLGQDSIFVINPYLYKKMPVDVRHALVPVSTIATNTFVLAINPSVPAKTFQEFIEIARKSNPPLTYASGGNGSQHHLMMEMLKQRAGIELMHVPYKGGAPATTATLAGETQVMFSGTSVSPQVKAGKLRAIASSGARRSEAFPDVPAIGEFYPGYDATIWLGMFAPAGTPQPIVDRLRDEVGKALASPEVRQKLNTAGGLQPLVLKPPEFAALIESDAAKYGKLVRELGITLD